MLKEAAETGADSGAGDQAVHHGQERNDEHDDVRHWKRGSYKLMLLEALRLSLISTSVIWIIREKTLKKMLKDSD